MKHYKRLDWGRQSNHYYLINYNGKKMWASVTFMTTRHINPRTEIQRSQRCKFSEFARNGTRELIRSCSNSKCEQAWHSCHQDTPIHVQRSSQVNDISSPSSLGMKPVSWLRSVQIEWEGNLSKRGIHANKTHQSTYRATVYSTM
jgi:hypothetical protein